MLKSFLAYPLVAAATLALAAACAPSAPAPASPAAQAPAAAQPTTAPSAASAPAAAGTPATFKLEDSEARYVVNETLANRPTPNDAIGATKDITGAISLNAQGQPVAADSKITVNVTNLKSDQQGRDNYLRRTTLRTEQYPTVTFVAKSIEGLKYPLTSGEVNFKMSGDLTVKDVTFPVTWAVTGTSTATSVKGKAVTTFTFADIKTDKPSVAVLLSVADTIRLELDFTVTKN